MPEITNSPNKVGADAKNGYSGTGQNQPGGGGGDLFAATQSVSKGGMRGIGLVAAIVADIILKQKALDIAEDYYKTNKRDYDFFDALHRAPMQQTVAEAFGPSNPNYIDDRYASAAAGMAKSAILDKQWFEARRRMPKYNTGQQAKLDYEMALARTAGVVAGWGLSDRYEINWADVRNTRAFNRKVEVTNIGINVGNVVRDGMSRATNNLATAYDNIGDTIASIGNGYAAKTGYTQGRADARQQYKDKRLT